MSPRNPSSSFNSIPPTSSPRVRDRRGPEPSALALQPPTERAIVQRKSIIGEQAPHHQHWPTSLPTAHHTPTEVGATAGRLVAGGFIVWEQQPPVYLSRPGGRFLQFSQKLHR